MAKITLIFIAIGVLAIILILNIALLIKKKFKGKEVNLWRSLSISAAVGLVICLLVAYNIYLSISLVADNKDEILDYGQKTISGVVEYGATAVFSGVGKSIDHFEKKWDKEYLNHLQNVELEVKSFKREAYNNENDKAILEVILNNTNHQDQKINPYNIASDNYLLLANNEGLLFPLSITHDQQILQLPVGKSVLKFESNISKNTQITHASFLNKEISLNK